MDGVKFASESLAPCEVLRSCDLNTRGIFLDLGVSMITLRGLVELGLPWCFFCLGDGHNFG